MNLTNDSSLLKSKQSLLHLLDILQSSTEFDMESFNYEVSLALSVSLQIVRPEDRLTNKNRLSKM